MVPKFYAIDRAEAVARRIARPLQAFRVLFHPFIVALTVVADGILRLLGVEPEPSSAAAARPTSSSG